MIKSSSTRTENSSGGDTVKGDRSKSAEHLCSEVVIQHQPRRAASIFKTADSSQVDKDLPLGECSRVRCKLRPRLRETQTTGIVEVSADDPNPWITSEELDSQMKTDDSQIEKLPEQVHWQVWSRNRGHQELPTLGMETYT